MANQRSPNCPQITFQEAAEKGRMVYNKEHTHPAAKEVIAESLGYSGINGRSLSMIAALRQYGILEGTGDALKITDDAVAYFELQVGQERRDALLRMVFHPPFFSQIRTDFPDVLPSESNLKHYLIKHGFLPKAAEDVIDVYRENIRLIEDAFPGRGQYNEDGGGSMAAASTALVPSRHSNEHLAPAGAQSNVAPTWSQSFALSKGVRADLTIKGDVTKDGLERLKTYIELTIAALKDESHAGLEDEQDDQNQSVG